MLYVDIPTLPEFKALASVRGDSCVSIYLPTTPLPQDSAVSRAQLKTFGKAALDQLDEAGCDKRRQASIGEHLAELEEDDEFWRFQAHSLAVLMTPETMRTFRLPNRLTAMVEVSDRFHLKPLLRAVTFPHEAFLLALSENAVRLVEVFADLPPNRSASTNFRRALPTLSGAPRSTTDRPAGAFRDWRDRRCCCVNIAGASIQRFARFSRDAARR
jgi:Bacterial archaeo-eukaryotic release factor family 11